MAKKQQQHKKGKPWMPSITCQRTGFFSQIPHNEFASSLTLPLFLDVSRPKTRCKIDQKTPATEDLLWMLHKKSRHKTSMAPIDHLFDSHENCNPECCPAKENK
jgi:hypothetical protein